AAPLKHHLTAEALGAKPATLAVAWPGHGAYELVEVPVVGGHAGYFRRTDALAQPVEASLAHISGIIDALTTPIAIFNAKRELVQFNPAYAQLWQFDPKF